MSRIYSTDNGRLTEIYDEEKLSTMVYNTIKFYKEQSERLTKENTALRTNGKEMADQALKNEINHLKEKLSLSYGAFASEKEARAYDDFLKEHMHDDAPSKYNGGRVPYLIPTETGIGTLLKVVCPICGESKDITDTEAW